MVVVVAPVAAREVPAVAVAVAVASVKEAVVTAVVAVV